MRWDELFADIESQLEQELDAERLEEAVEEERLRLGRLTLRERIAAMSAPDRSLGIETVDGERAEIVIETVGRDWFAGAMQRGTMRASIIVPLHALASVVPSGDQIPRGLRPQPAPTALSAQLGLAFVLRDLCRRRLALDVRTSAGVWHGTIDRVGRDHLDLAEHDRGEPRRDRVVRRIRLVPFDALLDLRF